MCSERVSGRDSVGKHVDVLMRNDEIARASLILIVIEFFSSCMRIEDQDHGVKKICITAAADHVMLLRQFRL